MKSILTLSITLFLSSIIIAQTTVSTFPDGTPDDAIAIDSNGNLYGSNFTGDTVFKFDALGNMTPFITGLNTPNGLAFDSSDNLYVCDFSANTIFRFDDTGVLDTSIIIPGNPSGLIKAFDNDDMIYTRFSGNTINRITPAGVITEVSSAPELNGPVGLTYDEFGILYVGNYNNREIYRVEANGDLTYIAQLPASGPMPNLGFITYAQGRIFGTVLGDHKIYSVDPNEVDSYLLFAGSVQGTMDGNIAVATFDRPNGILANATGDVIYVTDFGSKNLRIISDVILGISDNLEIDTRISVFPNPVVNGFTISGTLKGARVITITVNDALGKQLLSKVNQLESANFNEYIDSSSWKSGVYFVTLKAGDRSVTKRVVK